MFNRGALFLLLGTIGSQVIPIMLLPFISRLYSAEEFATLSIFMALSGFFSIIFTLKLELGIPVSKNNRSASELYRATILIAILLYILTTLFIFLFINVGGEIFSLKNHELLLIPTCSFLLALININQSYLNYFTKYQVMALNRFVNSVGNNLFNLIYVMNLTYGAIFGLFASCLFVTRFKELSVKKNRILKAYVTLKRNSIFPKTTLPHALINSLKINSIPIVFPLLFSKTELGYYFFANKILLLPSMLIGASVAQVFFRSIAKRYNEHKSIEKNVLFYMLTLFLIAAIPSLLTFEFLPDLFGFVFGDSWIISGEYAKMFLPYIVLHFVASSSSVILIVIKKQKQALYWGVIESIMFVFIFLVGSLVGLSVTDVLFTVSMIFSVYFPVYFIWIYKSVRNA
ncbi:lipopolysaccharide biosynthesis protein [Vibrio sp. B1Z05]|uniref:lipopolysaccharide biosynthesis protein n=1 Tax=Vibrio sp. B1Z05 TaxID=2654980 RepID=UPI00128C0D1F|nr:oligosaccharide flippase family protein [Vibrio sp. B1Z05]MPW36264.1 oligosaccharide flippase family protein [Vibrio sp. B1Z05]